jgi:hypothetical protein
MTTLRKNEFIDMMEMNNLLFEDKDKFIHCDIPTLGKVTYYPKSDKLQVCKLNKWEESGFQYVKTILQSIIKTENTIQQSTSLVKVKEIKSDEELRDEFAGLVLSGIMASGLVNPVHQYQFNNIVEKCYRLADEMLKQRKL